MERKRRDWETSWWGGELIEVGRAEGGERAYAVVCEGGKLVGADEGPDGLHESFDGVRRLKLVWIEFDEELRGLSIM